MKIDCWRVGDIGATPTVDYCINYDFEWTGEVDGPGKCHLGESVKWTNLMVGNGSFDFADDTWDQVYGDWGVEVGML